MSQEIQLQVTSVQERYQEGEHIILRVTLWNFGEDPRMLNARLALSGEDGPGEISFQILGPNQKPMPFQARVNIGAPDKNDFSWVLPWNSVGRQYDMESFAEFDFRAKGKYTVVARYAHRKHEDREDNEAWVGTVTSSPITFEMK